MPEMIRDGKGRGFLAEVNEQQQLTAVVVAQREESYIADKFGETYIISTNGVILNSINQHVLLYIKNTSSVKKLYHATLEAGYNGGSTNYDRSMKLQILAGFTGPSANHGVCPISNVNFSSGNVAEADAYRWDGVGDGMTIAGGGIVNEGVFPMGLRLFETYGLPIMGLNDYMAIAVEAEEIGNVSVAIRLFYK